MKEYKEKKSIRQLISITIGVIGLLGSIASIYALFLSQKQVSLTFDVISKTNVLDINTDISDLDIIFKERSLKKEKKNLKLVLIRVKNNGTEDILKNFYDEKDPLSITPINSTIVDNPEITQTSNQYLKKNLKITIDSTGKAIFSQVILDKNSFFIIKLLLLINKDEEPKLEVNGKVAGINEKLVINNLQPQIELPFFKQVFLGDVWIQIVKSIVYFIIVLVLIISTFLTSEGISDLLKKAKRKKTVKKFMDKEDYHYKIVDKVIFDSYKKGYEWELVTTYNLVQDETKLNEKFNTLQNKLKEEKEISSHKKGYTDKYMQISESLRDIERLISYGYVTKENEKLIINNSVKETLNKFIEFAEINTKREFYGGHPIYRRIELEEGLTEANKV